MLNYILRRLAIGAVTLLLITFIVYGLIRRMPGTPLTMDAAMALSDPSKKISKEEIARLNAQYGLDLPWYVAYFKWLRNVAGADLGRSFAEKKPVLSVILERLGPTLLLSTTSLFLAYLLAVPMGLWSTARSGGMQERMVSVLLFMLYSLPSYVAALFLLVLFAVRLEGTAFQLPLTGMVSPNFEQLSFFGKALDVLRHLILPVTCLTYGGLAYDSRFIKSNMEEVMRQDYIRTARAKGVGPFRVLVQHAFRNTLIPFVTLLGLTLPALVSGSIILEQIFTWPGMGLLFFESITRRDYPVIMALTLIFSVLTLIGQLLADILYAVVDPRITYS